jgi:predicted kinase
MDETRNLLICMVGYPRAGKSGKAQELGYPIVNPDSIRLALQGQAFHAPAEPMVWAIAHTMVRSLFLAGHKVVVLDACNNTRKSRDAWKSEEWQTAFYHIPTLPRTCMERAEKGSRFDLIDVINRMARNYEPLEEDEIRWP